MSQNDLIPLNASLFPITHPGDFLWGLRPLHPWRPGSSFFSELWLIFYRSGLPCYCPPAKLQQHEHLFRNIEFTANAIWPDRGKTKAGVIVGMTKDHYDIMVGPSQFFQTTADKL